jgi:hypothetical protein
MVELQKLVENMGLPKPVETAQLQKVVIALLQKPGMVRWQRRKVETA